MKKEDDKETSPPVTKGNLVGARDWWAGGGDDSDFPITYRHRYIKPTGEAELRKPRGGFLNLTDDYVHMYTYDDLAITPWDMLSESQRDERIKKFGISGSPYKTKADAIFRDQTPKPSSAIIPKPTVENVEAEKDPNQDLVLPTNADPNRTLIVQGRNYSGGSPQPITQQNMFEVADSETTFEGSPIRRRMAIPSGNYDNPDVEDPIAKQMRKMKQYAKPSKGDGRLFTAHLNLAKEGRETRDLPKQQNGRLPMQMPIPESPNLNVTPPQNIGDTVQSVAPLPMNMAPTAPTERMLPEMRVPNISMPDISITDIDMPDLSLSEKLLQAQGMLGSLWKGAKDVGGNIMDDVASAGSTVSSFLQDKVEDIKEEVSDAVKFSKEAEETVAAKSQQLSNYLSDIFTSDSEEAEAIIPKQAPAKKSRTEAFAEMLRGSVPNMPDVALPKMQMPDISMPDLPDLPNVSMPDIATPKFSFPDVPDISMPDAPNIDRFTGYAKEVISNAVESGQSSLADLKTFFKEELVDYAKNFAERTEGIEESVHSVIDAAKDLPGLLASISSVEKEIGSVEPDLVLSPEDANPKETFEEMLIRGANSLQSGHILAGDVMYRVENGEITKRMETIVGKTTSARKGAPSKLSYAATIPEFWHNDDGSLREFETPEGLKTGPEIIEEGLAKKYSGTTPAGIYKFTNEPAKGYEKKKGYSSKLEALPGTPKNFVTTKYKGKRGKAVYKELNGIPSIP
jgi:hypothetical protein